MVGLPINIMANNRPLSALTKFVYSFRHGSLLFVARRSNGFFSFVIVSGFGKNALRVTYRVTQKAVKDRQHLSTGSYQEQPNPKKSCGVEK